MREKIIVVSNDYGILDTIASILEARDYSVIKESSKDGIFDALVKLGLQGNPANKIFLDFDTPGLADMELLRLLKESSPTLDIIIMTRESVLPEMATHLKAANMPIMGKPFGYGELLAFFKNPAQRFATAQQSQSV